MIFITVGTQDKQFTRLFQIIDKAIDSNIITDEVIAQIGNTKYKSKNIKTYKFMSDKRLNEYIDNADLIVTHGGIGILSTSLCKKKKIFAMPRLKVYKEHVNDHQDQIVNKFSELGYIKKINSYDEFVKEYKKLDKFKPSFPVFNNDKIINIISNFIN